jgi:hypothetical protein
MRNPAILLQIRHFGRYPVPLQALRLAGNAGSGLIDNSMVIFASMGSRLRQLALLGLQRVNHDYLVAALAQMPMLQVGWFQFLVYGTCGQTLLRNWGLADSAAWHSRQSHEGNQSLVPAGSGGHVYRHKGRCDSRR